MDKKIKAAFFDRDGTLIKDVSYLSDIKKVELLPGIINFCSILQNLGYKLFVVTNQSGIARGFFDESFVEKTHKYISDIFKSNDINFEKFYYCPHHPTKGIKKEFLLDCDCRKPKSGMLLKAADEFNIDLKQSLMFGDKNLDIQSGNSVGCKSFYIQDILDNNFEKNSIQNLIRKRDIYVR